MKYKVLNNPTHWLELNQEELDIIVAALYQAYSENTTLNAKIAQLQGKLPKPQNLKARIVQGGYRT